MALQIANEVLEIATDSRYQSKVKYRGDIALIAGDIIYMPTGKAPTNVYRLIRHELHWDGSLSGNAVLNI
jgi:hypothetical protein